MGEGVLPTDDMARRPPGAHIWMSTLGDEDIAEALHLRRIVERKVLQLVQALEVEDYRAAAAVDLEAIAVFAARGEACRLEAADGAIGKACDEDRSVINGNLPALRAGAGRETGGGRREGPLLD